MAMPTSARLEQAVEQALGNALAYYRDAACFEGKFKEELEYLEPDAAVKREAPCQWEVTMNGDKVFVSLRAKGPAETLQRLKHIARDVRRVLLGDRAAWLKALGRDAELEEFIDDVRNRQQEDHEDGRFSHQDGEVLCEWCHQSIYKDRLGGRHHCRMIANYNCPGCGKSWTTQRARYDLQEDRLLGQDCEKCGSTGEVMWSVVLSQQELSKLQQRRDDSRLRSEKRDAQRESGTNRASERCTHGYVEWAADPDQPSNLNAPEEEEEAVATFIELTGHDDPTDLRARTDYHRPDLCEACKRYGDCTGAFMDPFVMFVAARLLLEEWLTEQELQDEELEWEGTDDGWQLISENLGNIELVPHIYTPSQERSPHASGWSASSASGSAKTPDTTDWEIVQQHFTQGNATRPRRVWTSGASSYDWISEGEAQ